MLSRYDALPRGCCGMKRREFITLLGGAAVAPLTAHGQQIDRVRRVGVLMAHTENDPEFQSYLNAFREGLQKRGWIEGRAATLEAITSIARAGAGIVITYAAADVAQWLREDDR